MRLEAHLTTRDLSHAFAQLTPLSIALDPGSPQRQLSIKPPSAVSLEHGRGLRLTTELQLQWDVIGVRVPVTLRRVEILLSPRVEQDASGPLLTFGLRIESADVSAIPSLLREVLVARVNDALARPEARVVWRFLETLDFEFPLRDQVQPGFKIRLFARDGAVHVEDGALRISVEWGLTAEAERGNLRP
jgi:hypothetical protein